MKKSLSVLLCIIMLMSALSLSSFAAISTTLSANPSKANVGDVITMTVNVGAGLSGINLELEYDTSYFEYLPNSVKEGTKFVVVINADNPGKHTIAAVALTEQPACTLYTAEFKVLKTGGKMTLRVTQAIDGNDNDITSIVSGTVLTVSQGNGAISQEPISSASTQPAIVVSTSPNPANGNKETTTKAAGASSGGNVTVAPPPPDEPLPDDIMPVDDDPLTVEAQQDNKDNSKLIIIVAVVVLVLAAAVIIALLLKKKKQSENDENLSAEQ